MITISKSKLLKEFKMLLVRLETEDGSFVGIVEILPFFTPPKVLIWGNRVFILHSHVDEEITYRECFAVVSITGVERALELAAETTV